jgi:hypothetical protein
VFACLGFDETVLLASAEKSLKTRTSKLVAGGCFELYSAYPIHVPAVPASVATE